MAPGISRVQYTRVHCTQTFPNMRYLLVLVALLACASGKVISGDLATVQTNIGFLAHFAFSKAVDPMPYSGSVDFQLHAENVNKAQNLVVYAFDDEPSSWPSVFNVGLSCTAFAQQAKNSWAVSWDASGNWDSGQLYFTEHTRPREWYFVITNCVGGQLGATFSGVTITSAHFLNNYGAWSREFGADQMGLNTLYLLFWLHAAGLTCAWIYGLKNYQESFATMHLMLKLLSLIVLLYFFGMMFNMIHFIKFGNDGVGSTGSAAFGDLLLLVARSGFVLFLLLLSKGWTVSTAEMKDRPIVLGTAGTFLLFSLIMWIWALAGFDPISTTYLYDQVPGIMLCIIAAVVSIIYAYSLHQTRVAEPDEVKRNLYWRLAVAFLAYLLIPVLVTAFAPAIDPWAREVAITTLFVLASACAYTHLVWLFWPSRVAEYFQVATNMQRFEFDQSAAVGTDGYANL